MQSHSLRLLQPKDLPRHLQAPAISASPAAAILERLPEAYLARLTSWSWGAGSAPSPPPPHCPSPGTAGLPQQDRKVPARTGDTAGTFPASPWRTSDEALRAEGETPAPPHSPLSLPQAASTDLQNLPGACDFSPGSLQSRGFNPLQFLRNASPSGAVMGDSAAGAGVTF